MLLLLAGCAALPAPRPEPGGFTLRGKVGVVDGARSFSARFLWQQRDDAFDIELWGPFGQGRVQLLGDRQRLALVDGDGQVLSRGRPEAVMREQLGWALPLSVLPRWVQGEPDPALPVAERVFDEAGQLVAFRQLDWQVQLQRFAPAGSAGRVLPFLVSARRADYRVRLAISGWQI
ncbi:MAG: lipoprotein insertase outer membrane protein LolB [Pseudomonadales bacterium]